MMDCGMCKVIAEPDGAPDIVYRSSLFTVCINPRWSPHLGRVAIAPNRHIGDEGMYGLDTLTSAEHREFTQLRIKVTDALVSGFTQYGMRKREKVAHIDYIIRPGQHPSADLFPSYEAAAQFGKHTFPMYLPMRFYAGSAPDDIQDAPAVLASLAKPALLMPEPLRRELSSYIRSHLRV